ncbi:hypothetical protein HMPREF9696_02069 [Afipia clevelandensis ATCC 49720]|uniref:Uncharacterized protein n=1 Tax=Afipia clevelandensis ATCC 49720 TaxID=883079 RepID=K8NZV4_9BRAD|nr:hypothetical protein HMPREF9696_02069 [Afipia clevelandensis ATCC 49720]
MALFPSSRRRPGPTFYLSPFTGRGRSLSRAKASGEGRVPALDAPHPNPLPVNGERELRAIARGGMS